MPRRPNDDLPEPWASFLSELNKQLSGATQLHCLGGFVLKTIYHLPRPTSDLDYIAVIPYERWEELRRLAGRDSQLARKHRVWIEHVTVADVPEDYRDRLSEIAAGHFSKLRLWALDPYDLLLAKLTRNHPVDREDAKFLVKAAKLDEKVLRNRYQTELRPCFADLLAQRHDQTLTLWIEAAFPRA